MSAHSSIRSSDTACLRAWRCSSKRGGQPGQAGMGTPGQPPGWVRKAAKTKVQVTQARLGCWSGASWWGPGRALAKAMGLTVRLAQARVQVQAQSGEESESRQGDREEKESRGGGQEMCVPCSWHELCLLRMQEPGPSAPCCDSCSVSLAAMIALPNRKKPSACLTQGRDGI